jgi:hypothetical protein
MTTIPVVEESLVGAIVTLFPDAVSLGEGHVRAGVVVGEEALDREPDPGGAAAGKGDVEVVAGGAKPEAGDSGQSVGPDQQGPEHGDRVVVDGRLQGDLQALGIESDICRVGGGGGGDVALGDGGECRPRPWLQVGAEGEVWVEWSGQ